MNRRRSSLAAACALLASCVVPQGRPHVDASIAAKNAYVFRGVPQVDGAVLQPEIVALAPEYSGGSWYGSVWGNLNLTDDNGDAAISNGRGGEFVQINLVAGYERPLGPLDVRAQIVNYNFPNLSARSTSEVAAAVSARDCLFTPTITGYYDIDEAEGFYGTFSLRQTYSLHEAFSTDHELELGIGAAIGWLDEDQALFYVGADESGFADLTAEARLDWYWYQRNSFWVSTSWVSMVDDELRDALDARGLDENSLVVAVGATWRL